MDFVCPICDTKFNDEKHRIGERLGSLGYLHLDIWIECPKCSWKPAFGRELSDSKPIYVYPPELPEWYKQKVKEAFQKHIPVGECPFHNGEMELHKLWVHTWKVSDKEDWQGCRFDGAEKQTKEDQFLIPRAKNQVVNYTLPSGILGQFKCKNWKCKYVRYVTL